MLRGTTLVHPYLAVRALLSMPIPLRYYGRFPSQPMENHSVRSSKTIFSLIRHARFQPPGSLVVQLLSLLFFSQPLKTAIQLFVMIT